MDDELVGNPEDCTIRTLLDKRLFTRSGPQCAVCSAWRKPCPRCAGGSMAAVISTAQVDALLVQQPTEVGRLDHSEELLGKVIFEIIVRKKYRRQRVTRNRQPAGIGQWAARPDNAHTGHGSSSRAVWFGSVDTAGLAAVSVAA